MFLIFVYFAGLGGVSYLVYLSVKGLDASGLRIGNGCLYTVKIDTAKYALIKVVFDDTLALGLLLFKSIQHAKFNHLFRRSSRASILTVMARDGVLCFFLNLAITVTNMILFGSAPDDLRNFLFTTEAALQNVLCARLLFHIQSVNEASLQPIENSTELTDGGMEMNGFGHTTPSELKFADNQNQSHLSTMIAGDP